MEKMKIKTKKHVTPFMWLGFVVILVYTFSLLFVLAWGAMTALKSVEEFGTITNGNTLGIPRNPTFENFARAFYEFKLRLSGPGENYAYIEHMFLNSCLYVFGGAFVSIFTRLLVAYAVAKFDFIGKKFLYTTVIVTMVIPIVGSLPSEIKMAHDLGIYDTLIGTYLMKGGFTGMDFLVFYAAFKSVPNTYMEAAEIDGAGHFRVMFTIMIPLIRNVCFALYITSFIALWNDYYTQMMYLPSMPGFAYGLYRYTASNAGDPPGYMAIALMVSVPIILVFICFRNKIMGNIAIGGIKG